MSNFDSVRKGMSILERIIIMTAVAVGLAACIPQADEAELTKDLVVITNFDTSIDFNNYQSFVIREDTVGLVSNQTSQTIITGNSYAVPVVDGIIAHLTSRGYTQVSADQNPDLGIYVFVLDQYNAFQQLVYPNYYPGSYYGGYGYYGYYGPYVQTYYSNYATLAVQIVDLKNAVTNADVIWLAYIGDLYATPTTAKSVEAITQAFAQSDYLGRN